MLSDVIPNIYTYSIIAANLILLIYFSVNMRKYSVPTWIVIFSAIGAAFFSAVGARLMWVLEVFPDVDIRDVFYFGVGGWRLLGALLFAIIAIIVITFIFKKYYNVPIQNTLDICLEGAFLTLALDKFGCLLEGCCYGIETTLPWGMTFEDDGILRHPTQIYESFALFMIFILIRILRNKLSTSQRYALAIFLYVVTRMLIEPLRAEASVFIDGPTRIIYYILLIICVLIIFKDKILAKIKQK